MVSDRADFCRPVAFDVTEPRGLCFLLPRHDLPPPSEDVSGSDHTSTGLTSPVALGSILNASR